MKEFYLLILSILPYLGWAQVCNSYICQTDLKTCTQKNSTNVYLNPSACASKSSSSPSGGYQCFISEDESESHCVKETSYNFPTFLYPGYSCTFGDTASMCVFGPK